ncbi:Galactokinase [Candida viswanathii]|uniref:Galactokinase n=1 Tax=Candida viswanathii TaxID=5486 RepID=A0A367Y7L6_9ASCO|nr:Galactokinase [Candida viswanathii]
MSVPAFNDLSFYSDPHSNEPRYQEVASTFEKSFPGSLITFFARSPGRVNLIGDHIDYNFFPVLPMAISNDVIAAVSVDGSSNEIVITNTAGADFPREVIPLTSKVTIDQEHHSWANYFKCALIVAEKYLKEKGVTKLKGMKLTFNGNVPTGGGLSSSAAFCVASTLAVIRANGIEDIPKADLTKITIVSEHYVGVNTGGMDQCASIYGELDHALLIEFRPQLTAKPFKFPIDDLIFVITNSLQVSNKHETAPIHYNLRVVEMGIAADLLSKKLGLLAKVPRDSNIGTASLRGVMDGRFGNTWDGHDYEVGISQLTAMIDVVEQELNNQQGYSIEECCQELGITCEKFGARYLSRFPVHFETLKLYQRAKHVYKESLRVLETLKAIATIHNREEFLMEFGKLMNESQQDLDELNESSNEKLNSICQIALQNGSYGSRVTGAGWGGSIVHLTTVDKAEQLVEGLTREYYNVEFPDLVGSLDDAIINSKPSIGSCIVSNSGFLQ